MGHGEDLLLDLGDFAPIQGHSCATCKEFKFEHLSWRDICFL